MAPSMGPERSCAPGAVEEPRRDISTTAVGILMVLKRTARPRAGGCLVGGSERGWVGKNPTRGRDVGECSQPRGETLCSRHLVVGSKPLGTFSLGKSMLRGGPSTPIRTWFGLVTT